MNRKTQNQKKTTYRNISPETDSLIREFRKVTKEIIKSNKSKEFLIETGIYNRKGQLSKAFR